MLAALLSYLLLYKYIALFVFVFAVAVVVPLPANGVLLAAGAFASFGYFNLPISILVAVVANVAGDLFDYLLARRYGPRIFEKFKVKNHYYFKRIEHGVREHAGFTIFITRFAGPIDLIGTLFAGSIGIPIGTFLTFDLLGNFFSTVIVIIIGYFAGSYWQNFSGIVDTASAILLVGIVIFLMLRIFLRRRPHSRTDGVEEVTEIDLISDDTI